MNKSLINNCCVTLLITKVETVKSAQLKEYK